MLAVSVPAGISTLVVDEGLAVPTNTYAPVDTFVMLKKTLDVFAGAWREPVKVHRVGRVGVQAVQLVERSSRERWCVTKGVERVADSYRG